MTVHRKLAAIAVVGAAPLAYLALAAAPASAHGAPDSPISRGVACGLKLQQNADSAACKAAIAASDGEAFKDWDNVRVPNINGRDRELIPDGKLCSGGIDRFKGLDLARTDWPSTNLTAGTNFTFTYRETIPHQGSFKFFVTKDGYDATRPLTWASLEDKPFLQVKDPPLTGDAYVMKGKLPAGKDGRHMIFTIWQNTSTPDTYYSCSDVVFAGGTGGAAAPPPATNQNPSRPPAVTNPGQIVDQAAPGADAEPGTLPSDEPTNGTAVDDAVKGPNRPVAAANVSTKRNGAAMALTTGGIAALAGVGLAAVVLIRRRRHGLQPASARSGALARDGGVARETAWPAGPAARRDAAAERRDIFVDRRDSGLDRRDVGDRRERRDGYGERRDVYAPRSDDFSPNRDLFAPRVHDIAPRNDEFVDETGDVYLDDSRDIFDSGNLFDSRDIYDSGSIPVAGGRPGAVPGTPGGWPVARTGGPSTERVTLDGPPTGRAPVTPPAAPGRGSDSAPASPGRRASDARPAPSPRPAADRDLPVSSGRAVPAGPVKTNRPAGPGNTPGTGNASAGGNASGAGPARSGPANAGGTDRGAPGQRTAAEPGGAAVISQDEFAKRRAERAKRRGENSPWKSADE